MYTISRPGYEGKVDDDEETIDEPVVHLHSEVFACFSKCVRWLEAQMDFDPVSAQLLHHLQQRVANKSATALKQQRIASFFVLT